MSTTINKEYRYKVSVVTAVCNAEAYLAEMIKSVLAQTIGFENIQLILIDDGSKDASGEICDRFRADHPDNIRVIHKENEGVSSARNRGLEIAEGEFINFCDADDMLADDVFQKMASFLESHSDLIDVVAVPMIFFGDLEGDHVLNYKFEETGIIDLQKDYDHVQLAVNSVLVKADSIRGRRFCEKLSYAEDARFINEILLDKMRYGVIADTGYLYRKHGDSALDGCRRNVSYYDPVIRNFTLHLLNTAERTFGYIPRFIQYTCMYDLQWRVKGRMLADPGILSREEEKDYYEGIVEALSLIDAEVISRQRFIDGGQKKYLIELKSKGHDHGWKKTDVDMIWCCDDIEICRISEYEQSLCFLRFEDGHIEIEGYKKLPAEIKDVFFYLSDTRTGKRYPGQINDLNKRDGYCLGKKVTSAKSFNICIPCTAGDYELHAVIDDHDIMAKDVSTGSFFPLTHRLEHSYFCRKGLLLGLRQGRLVIEEPKHPSGSAFVNEMRLLAEMYRSRDRMIRRGIVARSIYHILKPLKRRQLWFISDRIQKADDNGEALFMYINADRERKRRADTCFIIRKGTADYGRLKHTGKVLDYNSLLYRSVFLLGDKIISSSADEPVTNRFFSWRYLYQDIMWHQDFIFLQHGVTKGDLDGWLNRFDRNIRLFMTTTGSEYRSVINGDYYYSDRQVKLTGMPRYDRLYDDKTAGKIITVMPTWRAYLRASYDELTAQSAAVSGFKDSRYCRMYHELLSDERLFDAACKYGYTIQLMLHPAMPPECARMFECHRDCILLDLNTSYREIFAGSRLVVTDYSSAVFDLAYLGKPVLYYQADREEFYSGRHLYKSSFFDDERDGFGEVTTTKDDMVGLLIEYMENGCLAKEKYKKRMESFFEFHDTDNCKRVYEEICRLE